MKIADFAGRKTASTGSLTRRATHGALLLPPFLRERERERDREREREREREIVIRRQRDSNKEIETGMRR